METLRFLLVSTFYPPYHLGGDAVHVRYLANALVGQGHEVHVEFAPAAYRLKRRKRPDSTRPADEGIRLHPIPSPTGALQPLSAYAFGRASSVSRFHETLLDELHPDVVHLHNVSLLGLGVFAAPPRAVTLYTAHDYWLRCPRSDLFRFGRELCDAPTCVRCALVTHRPPQLWRGAAFGRALREIDAVIAPSRYMARALASWVPCPIVGIPNFSPDGNPAGDVADPEGYYLYAGVLETHKGIAELALGFTSRRDLRLVVTGRGAHQKLLRSLVDRGLLNGRIEGWVDEKRRDAMFRGANALVLPSLWAENAPLAAIEALSWGCPLLVSRRGGLPELLHDGAAGRSFEPTAAAIVDAIDWFEAEGLPRDMRAEARRMYEVHHRPATYLERYRAVIDGSAHAVQDHDSATSWGTADSEHLAPAGGSDSWTSSS